MCMYVYMDKQVKGEKLVSVFNILIWTMVT